VKVDIGVGEEGCNKIYTTLTWEMQYSRNGLCRVTTNALMTWSMPHCQTPLKPLSGTINLYIAANRKQQTINKMQEQLML